MENNEENREKLAQAIIDSWDSGELEGYAIDVLSNSYASDDEQFQEDWKNVMVDTGKS